LGDWVIDLPRYPLATLPTPMTDAVRLRAALGGPSKCPRILIKRDDLTALGLGGNKARKLEYLIADALAKDAQTVITTGAVQSNHARMTAAAACIAGLRSVLVLTSRYDVPPVEGNLLLDRLFGADVRFVPSEDPMLAVGRDEEVVGDVVREEAAAGRQAYVIPSVRVPLERSAMSRAQQNWSGNSVRWASLPRASTSAAAHEVPRPGSRSARN
jgi:D-cysteine desulfhydrase/L-cysteate sulfo-lyase